MIKTKKESLINIAKRWVKLGSILILIYRAPALYSNFSWINLVWVIGAAIFYVWADGLWNDIKNLNANSMRCANKNCMYGKTKKDCWSCPAAVGCGGYTRATMWKR